MTEPATSTRKPTILALRARAIVGIQKGHYVASPTGKRISLVVGIRRVAGNTRVNLLLMPVHKVSVPPGATIHPWPSTPPREAKSERRPPAMHPAPSETRSQRQQAERNRAITLLADDRAKHPVASIRTKTITNGAGDTLRTPTAEPHEWIDPEDDNPNRRDAKKVRGFRRSSRIEGLQAQYGLVTRKHVKAANRFSRDHELAEVGRSPSRDLGTGGCGAGYGPGGGPTDAAIDAMKRYQAACAALGPAQFGILASIVLLEGDVTAYAETKKIHRNVAMGYLLASLDRLVEHYGFDKKDDQRNRTSDPTPARAG